MMFKVYLKRFIQHGQSEVDTQSMTTTPSAAAAVVAFRELLNVAEYAGLNIHVVLSRNGKQVAYHRYDRKPGEADYMTVKTPIVF